MTLSTEKAECTLLVLSGASPCVDDLFIVKSWDDVETLVPLAPENDVTLPWVAC